MLMDPREFKRGFPFLLATILAFIAFLASTGRGEAATCIAICACLTIGVRAVWGTLILPASLPIKALGFVVATAFGLVVLVAGYHVTNSDLPVAALAGGAAFLLWWMIPTVTAREAV